MQKESKTQSKWAGNRVVLAANRKMTATKRTRQPFVSSNLLLRKTKSVSNVIKEGPLMSTWPLALSSAPNVPACCKWLKFTNNFFGKKSKKNDENLRFVIVSLLGNWTKVKRKSRLTRKKNHLWQFQNKALSFLFFFVIFYAVLLKSSCNRKMHYIQMKKFPKEKKSKDK